MDSDSIQDAQPDISKIQSALEEAQKVLHAAHEVREATELAHEEAQRHAEMLRTVSMIAIGVIVAAALMGFRRRRFLSRQQHVPTTFLRDEMLAWLQSQPTVQQAS